MAELKKSKMAAIMQKLQGQFRQSLNLKTRDCNTSTTE